MQESSIFTTKKIALIAALAAIAFGISRLEFPLFPAAPFLKLDFSFAVILIGGFMLGPIAAEIILLAVQLLALILSSSGGVGELANFITGNCFIVLPSLIYRYRKGLKVVFASLALALVAQVVAALLINRFITFPLYGLGEEGFKSFFWYIVAFNGVKCFSNALITLLLYKRLKNLLNKFI